MKKINNHANANNGLKSPVRGGDVGNGNRLTPSLRSSFRGETDLITLLTGLRFSGWRHVTHIAPLKGHFNSASAFFIMILCLFVHTINAQIPLSFRFKNPNEKAFFEKEIKPISSVMDSLQAVEILRGYAQTLHNQLYLETSFDSLYFRDSILIINTFVGKRYEGIFLHEGNMPSEILNAIGFRKGKKWDYKAVLDIKNALLTQAENTGYPFAQVWLDSIEIGSDIAATLMLKTGALFTFDTINTEGYAKIAPSFLSQYLGIKKGDIFNRAKVLQISQRLAELPFLEARQKPTLTFKENSTASVNLILDPKRASRWDFLVGVLPNTTSGGAQKFTVTFNGNADFQNLLGRGERIFANFENLRPQSPRSNVKLTFPYLLNTPFGFDGAFDLYKRDSQYIETQTTLGMQYLLGGNDYLKIFGHRYIANNLIINSLNIINSRQLPTTLDITTQTVGIEFFKNKLDYRFNPRRGWSQLLRGSAGVRQIRRNTDIVNLKDPNDITFNFSKLYDTVSLKNFQYKIESNSAFYIPVMKRAAVKIGLQSGFLIAPEKVSLNEQYRIGGSKILRGFNEEGIFATQYAVSTLEYRLLIGRNSYIYSFVDAGYFANITRTTRQYDNPIGFGAGITFETKVGLFGFTLAAGKEQGNPVDLRNTKTHFGYISLF
jgi:outer membrane protein assembly factor BamA